MVIPYSFIVVLYFGEDIIKVFIPFYKLKRNNVVQTLYYKFIVYIHVDIYIINSFKYSYTQEFLFFI